MIDYLTLDFRADLFIKVNQSNYPVRNQIKFVAVNKGFQA